MKNLLKTLFVAMACILFATGCSCSKDDEQEKGKVALLYGDLNATTFNEFDSLTGLNTAINKYQNGLLYVYTRGCECSSDFTPILNKAIVDNHLKVYGIEVSKINDRESPLYYLREGAGDSYSPALVLYEDGTVNSVYTYKDYESYFTSEAGFNSFLTEHTIMPTTYYINDAQLEALLAGNEEFIIYYDYYDCPFCKYMMQNYYKDWFKSHTTIKIKSYAYDTSAVRKNGTWSAFAKEHNLTNPGSDNSANPYGLTNGWTPTIQYYNNGVLSGAFIQSNPRYNITYSNDNWKFSYKNGTTTVETEEQVNARLGAGKYAEIVAELNRTDDGSHTTTYYYITESYFSDNPWIRVIQKSTEYNSNMHDFYKTKLYNFLNEHLA